MLTICHALMLGVKAYRSLYDLVFRCEHIDELYRYDQIFCERITVLQENQEALKREQLVQIQKCAPGVDELFSRIESIWTSKKQALTLEKEALVSQRQSLQPLADLHAILAKIDRLSKETEKDCGRLGQFRKV